ncbi:n-terminal acetyltransferase catalytic subunit [Lasallia pustulata]|uniref:N-terminal acetyltransferase catalytic subunit n=1 Tax=Lasallia pustulata TaxID=136370 RepID=A0A1W5D765_9LECA|nr:n-terminal acetyltransferase catalytic subunit [Lasallia pustulata]
MLKRNEKDLIASLSLEDASLEDAIAGMELLDEWYSSAEVVKQYKEAAGKRWKEATVFKTV